MVDELKAPGGYTYYAGTKFLPKVSVRGVIVYIRTPVGICEADLYGFETPMPALYYICPKCGYELMVPHTKGIRVYVERDNPRPVLEDGVQIGKDTFIVTVEQSCKCDHYLNPEGEGGGDKCGCRVRITENVMSFVKR